MTRMRMTSLNLARSRYVKPFLCTLVGFDLWHWNFSFEYPSRAT
jgi:hypothetical protein